MTEPVPVALTPLKGQNDQQQPPLEQRLATDQGREALKDILCGSVAGIVGKTIEYPFDTVKVRLQSQPDHLPLRYTGPLDCFRQSYRSDGFSSLYRGISAPLVGAAIETSSLFFSYRIAQDVLSATLLEPRSAGGSLPLSALTACGAASGAFTSLVLTPIELVKCKMQVHSSSPPSRSLVSIIASVFRHDGILGFWRGQLGTLIRETGGTAAWFGSYEGASAVLRRYNESKAHTSSPEEDGQGQPKSSSIPLYQQLLAGAIAGVSYNFSFFPADTIKSRMQTEEISHGSHSASSRRSTFWTAGASLWRQQGIKGMYRGCGITIARAAPSSAFIFAIYEKLRDYLQ